MAGGSVVRRLLDSINFRTRVRSPMELGSSSSWLLVRICPGHSPAPHITAYHAEGDMWQ
jgi:hypothetical protein